jgi:formylglycine-generating enzyme required for sulfatase activity
MKDSHKSCCSPSRHVADKPGKLQPAAEEFERIPCATKSLGMQLIPSGSFLMGNDRDYGHLADGESPAHPVEIASFWLDQCAVTNEQFNEFINATSYKTDAEFFGWSFVFAGDLTAQQFARGVRAVVQGSEWWCRVEGANWRHPEGEGTNIKQRWRHPGRPCFME